MIEACNSAEDKHNARRAGGGGDCIICVKKEPDDLPLDVIQVIEGMAHHRENKCVDIPILMVVHNPHDKPIAMRIVHRAFVRASLKRFRFHDEKSSENESWESRDPRKKQMMDVLRGLYASRLQDKSGTAIFQRRVNCLGLRQELDTLSLEGPNQCFSEKEEIDLEPDFDRDFVFFQGLLLNRSGEEQIPSYCSYSLPAVGAGRTELFVLWLTLKGAAYQRLIGDSDIFTVDSSARLLRQIKTFDLDVASDDAKKFHNQYIEPNGAIIVPAAYDIVIFQDEMGDSIALDTGSISILPVQPKSERWAKQALWFYGHPEEFYLVLRYKSEPTPTTPVGFVVESEPTSTSLATGFSVNNFTGTGVSV